MGGEEILKRLKAIDPGLNAIVSSSYSDDPIIADYAKSGFKTAMIKPYTLNS